ncbi:MAG: undecaprenyl-diphosphate phosphatase [Paludibacteraceae bacterium]|nr:undecaprenyl-diphosphate phosphatase [Paludibacteraceae bacterium]MBP6284703.1 undecaprenyl-diphosphate phosphatase [Paludibacteraceae bacterium]
MTILETIIIAIVEGLTEFLPVSSTGHMIIAQALLGIESTEFVKAFTVNIQFGAILAVVVLYWQRFFHLNDVASNTELVGKSQWKKLIYKYDFYVKLFVAFIPAGVIGFLAGDYIDMLLESVEVVAIMLLLGGIFMLFIDKLFNKFSDDQSITYKRSWVIGFFQCIAMVPGVSRSMATIVGGLATKLNRKNAAEFSFFLAVPTMAAAAGYTLLKLITQENAASMLMDNILLLVIGNVVAFVVAIAAIKFFIEFITKYGFKAFGWYRIIVSTTIIILLIANVDLTLV